MLVVGFELREGEGNGLEVEVGANSKAGLWTKPEVENGKGMFAKVDVEIGGNEAPVETTGNGAVTRQPVRALEPRLCRNGKGFDVTGT